MSSALKATVKAAKVALFKRRAIRFWRKKKEDKQAVATLAAGIMISRSLNRVAQAMEKSLEQD